MPPIQLLIKPVSGWCNMSCKYCFYKDLVNKRTMKCLDFMTAGTLELVVRRAMEYADGVCTFAFQGGEPTLTGLDFYKQAVSLQEKYRKPGVIIENVIQTNGYRLDSRWAEFFAQNNFLAGISLDGVRRTHDLYRLPAAGAGSFGEVMETIRLFKNYGVKFNILSVVHNALALNITRIYAFYKKNSFMYQQYIPCLEPLNESKGVKEYSLTPEVYGQFLITLFDLWYQDVLAGEQPYIRQFENYIAILLGDKPEACECKDKCVVQTVVESDGSVYPCDFYVLEQYCLGNLCTENIADILKKASAVRFVEESVVRSKECLSCGYYGLCRGGCARYREGEVTHGGDRNYFCKAYQEFFKAALPRLKYIAEVIRRCRK